MLLETFLGPGDAVGVRSGRQGIANMMSSDLPGDIGRSGGVPGSPGWPAVPLDKTNTFAGRTERYHSRIHRANHMWSPNGPLLNDTRCVGGGVRATGEPGSGVEYEQHWK